jgi:hypothetical protein
MKKLIFIILGSVMLSSCAKIFYAPDFEVISQSEKIIAIAPPTVSIAPNKKLDANAMIEQQKTESVNFQREMYSWLLKRQMQGKINIEIQDVETTNAKLENAKVEGKVLTPFEMCKILEVDGIMTSNYVLTKPMSEGAAVAVALLFGVWGNTNETTVSLSLHDYNTKKMFWNYDHKMGGSFSSPAVLVDALMQNASRNLPYIIKNK